MVKTPIDLLHEVCLVLLNCWPVFPSWAGHFGQSTEVAFVVAPFTHVWDGFGVLPRSLLLLGKQVPLCVCVCVCVCVHAYLFSCPEARHSREEVKSQQAEESCSGTSSARKSWQGAAQGRFGTSSPNLNQHL
eukprot:4589172-Amphidinium_carterae.1